MRTGDLARGACCAGEREIALDRHVHSGMFRPVDRGGMRDGGVHTPISITGVRARVPCGPPLSSGALGGGVSVLLVVVSHGAPAVACAGGVAVPPLAVTTKKAGGYLGLRLLRPPSTGRQ